MAQKRGNLISLKDQILLFWEWIGSPQRVNRIIRVKVEPEGVGFSEIIKRKVE